MSRRDGGFVRGETHHLNAENFIASHTFLPSPPRCGASTQIGQSPTLSLPFPLTKRGVYRSNASRGALYPPPGCAMPKSVQGDLGLASAGAVLEMKPAYPDLPVRK